MRTVRTVKYAGENGEHFRTPAPTLPATGLVTIPDLAKVLDLSEEKLVKLLNVNRVPILKLSRKRCAWLVSLERLHGTVLEVLF
jgi:hypothetical protein